MKLLAVASSLARLRARRVLLPLSLGLAVLCPACATTPPSVPEPAPAPAVQLLEEGRPVERTLGGGETHEHRIAVEAGWYVRLEVEQIGVDVVASLVGPDGASLFSTDDPDGLQDKEILAVIAPATGELRLVVTPHDPQTAPGAYRVELTARHLAGSGDAERAAAWKAITEAWRLLALQEGSGTRKAISFLDHAAHLLALAGETGERIDMLNEIGTQQLAVSEIPASVDSFQAALALAIKAGDLRRQARANANLAGAFLALADYHQSLERYRLALALWTDLGDSLEQGRVLYGMGLFYRDRGDLDAALRSLSAALPLRRVGGDAQGVLYTLVALANVHQGRGEMDQASDCLQQALDLSRSIGGEGEAVVLSTLAQFQRYRGELSDALKHANQSRAYYQRTGEEGYEARAVQNLGLIYLDLGDLDKAQSSYEEGLELVAGKNSEGEARFLNSLGWTLYLRGDPEGALRYFEHALSLSKEKNLPANMIRALGQTGVVYVTLGRTEEGLRLLQEELALRRENGDRAGEAKSLLEIGRAWQALGDLDQAAASFHDAFDLGSRMGNTVLQAACLYQWAVLDRQRGDLRQALDRVGKALEIIESVRSRVSSEKLRITYLASKRSWYELYVDLRMRLEDREPGRGHAASAFEASERARARGLLDLIAEGRIDLQEGIAADLKQRERELGARISWIQEELSQVATQESAAELRDQLDRVGEEMEQLKEEIRRRHPHYAEVRYPTPLRFDQVRSLLDERTALIEYFVGQESSFVFVVTRDGLSVHRLPAAALLAKEVQELRATLERPGILTLGRFRSESSGLYDVLLGPAAMQLKDMSNLLISPDGPLSLVPFEALLTDPARGASYRELSYLLRRHTVWYIPSASVLKGLRELQPAAPAETAPSKELVAFGNPIYPAGQVASAPVRGSAFSGPVPGLPGSGREVQAIASLYPPSDVELYMGERATEENVKRNPLLQTARRIHFATHGFVNEDRPQLSGLMLTRSPSESEDGFLQVFEIFNLQLNADLVALSACETGLGEQVTGEGMIGLTRGFIYAGARSLLVSLWPVSDLSTPELMTGFYRHLGSGTKAKALQEAKLERIGAGDEPYRWAPFILAGDSY